MTSRWLSGALLGAALLTASQATAQPRYAAAAEHGQSLKHDTSAPLRDVRAHVPPGLPKHGLKRFARLDPSRIPHGPGDPDPVLQTTAAGPSLPASGQNFEGLASVEQAGTIGFVLPPDTNGDVGPSHYVQWVNLIFAVYDKAGNRLLGPLPGSALWQGFPGVCGTSNDGDPVVLYDHLADRWVMSQLALPNFPDGPFYQCLAVSATGDPTGAFHRYEFLISQTKLNDYPKLGVWPDAYYLSVNQFDNCHDLFPPFGFIQCDWGGPRVVAFERTRMLAGQSAQMVAFELPTSNLGGFLPSHLNGPPPADGTPNYFVQVDDGAWFNPQVADRLQVWPFHVDWVTPAASSFGPGALLPTAPFDSNMCGYDPNCIPQPGTDFIGLPSPGVDALSDRLMYRLQYRSFGSYATLVTNHTVDTGGDRAGIRWYELRKGAGDPGWTIQQQGTYGPADGVHRWMGSAAMDQAGNIALGFSASSLTTWPSIRYATRQASDPPGQLGSETTVIDGTGAQEDSSGRWGDYSAMSVDPTDDCTFWYTQEYYETTDTIYGRNWQTRIASFKLPPCAPAGPAPTLSIGSATVTEGNGGTVQAVFTVTLSAASALPVSVSYATANGTATAGADYLATSGTLTFDPGITTRTVAVDVLGDTLDEADETFVVNLTSPQNATIAVAQGVGTITDDDPLPGLSINDVAVFEGNAGTTSAVFTVTLSAPSGRTVTVQVTTQNGIATAGSDYVAVSPAATLSFPPGTTTRTLTVTVNGDTAVEGDETFLVNLSGAVNAAISRAQGVGTIRNDDTAPPPAVTVVVPNTNVTWRIGQVQPISWSFTGLTGSVQIDLSRNGGSTWTNVSSVAVGSGGTGSATWTVTGSTTKKARIRVCSLSVPAVCDASNVNFTIASASVARTQQAASPSSRIAAPGTTAR